MDKAHLCEFGHNLIEIDKNFTELDQKLAELDQKFFLSYGSNCEKNKEARNLSKQVASDGRPCWVPGSQIKLRIAI